MVVVAEVRKVFVALAVCGDPSCMIAITVRVDNVDDSAVCSTHKHTKENRQRQRETRQQKENKNDLGPVFSHALHWLLPVTIPRTTAAW